MKRLTFVVCLSLALFASLAIAGDSSRDNRAQFSPVPFNPIGANTNGLVGAPLSSGKAAADTFYVIGGPAQQSGKWQDTSFNPDDQGWTGKDYTNQWTTWHLSTFNAPAGTAMWAGELFAGSCGEGDPAEGYDNNYNLWLDWYGTVAHPASPVLVTVTADLNIDAEDKFDYLTFEYEAAGEMTTVVSSGQTNPLTGYHQGVAFSATWTVTNADYVGVGLDQVHLRWHAESDGGYSDGDCSYPSSGHTQIDNIVVTFDQAPEGPVVMTTDDFESGTPSWVNVKPPYVGEFHKVWPLLGDADECSSNFTPQMAFIDDGIVVPGTGGTSGGPWNYGPGGYNVNTTGGLAGPDYGLNNDVWSPPVDWPAGAYDGATIRWNAYTHLILSNGIFFEWWIRTSLDGGVTWPNGWQNANTVYYGGGLATYQRVGYNVTPYMNAGRNKVQVAVGATEPWTTTYLGNDATPAPYFDNFALLAYTYGGPTLSVTGAWSLFNDGWPEISEIDYSDLSKNSVRVDIGDNLWPYEAGFNDPGDSVSVTVKAVRSGAVLTGRPTMHVRMKVNPLFNGVRTIPAGWTGPDANNIVTGSVVGDTTWTQSIPPVVMANLWRWDLPDTGFFFPGDSFHYYFRAEDTKAGVLGVSLMPADTTGFAAFPGNQYYDSYRYYELYKIDALPTMITAEKDVGQPHVLFWNDSMDRANQDEWLAALDNLGFRQGIDYDSYCEAAPSSGQGNGLGGRTNALKMSGYTTMLYTPGNLSNYTLSNGEPGGDAGDDLAVMDAWLSSGGKNLFATGDNIIQDLSISGTQGTDFITKWFGVALNSGNLRPLITGQLAPRVSPITVALAPVLPASYMVQGGCDGGINDFDAVTAIAPAVRIAQFMQPNGAAYPPSPGADYAAAVYNKVPAGTDTTRVVFMPYDLSYIWNGTTVAEKPARAVVLQTILSFFGNLPGGAAVGVTPDVVFSAKNFPNPFNPSTKIEFTLPRPGQVELKIYNVRGELVKTLLNQNMAAATHSVIWDGRDSSGQSVSSGVYFYSLKAGSYEKMEKMTLVK
jgi:hypothetical protein